MQFTVRNTHVAHHPRAPKNGILQSKKLTKNYFVRYQDEGRLTTVSSMIDTLDPRFFSDTLAYMYDYSFLNDFQ